ncbi:MAG: hypothetical protein GY754_39710 [bacterium]|nr:hypothetical protein [bacterium]
MILRSINGVCFSRLVSVSYSYLIFIFNMLYLKYNAVLSNNQAVIIPKKGKKERFDLHLKITNTTKSEVALDHVEGDIFLDRYQTSKRQ